MSGHVAKAYYGRWRRYGGWRLWLRPALVSARGEPTHNPDYPDYPDDPDYRSRSIETAPYARPERVAISRLDLNILLYEAQAGARAVHCKTPGHVQS